jgi:hypothetical protein
MDKGKVKDFLAAVSEEGFQAALEGNYVPEIVTTLGEMVTTESASILLGTIVGAAAPRVNGVRLNYLEKRFEARVGQALSLMKDKIELLESNYGALNEEMQEKFRSIYVEWFMDNLYSEKQPEKVSSHVNGYINMMSNDVNDNIMIMFMQTLNQLTQLDIDVLRLYQVDNDETAWNLSARYGIQMEQLSIIKEKLVRFGLLYSKQDDLRDENIDAVVKYLMALEAEQKKKNPKNIKMKNIKKPKSTESYYITPLGNDFLRKISD